MVASCLLYVTLLPFFVKENRAIVASCLLFVPLLSFFVKKNNVWYMLTVVCSTIVLLCKGKEAYGSILSNVFPTTVHPAVIILDKLKNFRKVYMSTVAVVAIPP